ncbi:MAG: hypothetical protein V4509_00545 [Patescibacteria group bacterium]
MANKLPLCPKCSKKVYKKQQYHRVIGGVVQDQHFHMGCWGELKINKK